jgi:type IV pilus assembly protein PilW
MRAMRNNREGFSLIELLIVLAMSGIVMSAIYSVFISTQKVFRSQQQIAEMQQNLRAGTLMMVNDIRMAGYDPTGDAGSGIVTLDADTITITKDLDGDGAINTTDEDITYSLGTSADGRQNLYRITPDSPGIVDANVVAENIEALNFIYLDGDGNVTATDSDVRSIQVAIVARASNTTGQFINNTSYNNLQGGPPIYVAAGDHYRRRLLATQIKCRNLSL